MLLWVSIARGEVFYGVTVNGIFKVDATTGTFSGGTYATVVKFATPISFAATSPSCTVTTGPGNGAKGSVVWNITGSVALGTVSTVRFQVRVQP